MRTAITVPDELFAEGESVAQRLNISRSELYATALSEYLAKGRRQLITDQLTAVYSVESSDVDPLLHRMQMASLDSNLRSRIQLAGKLARKPAIQG